MTIKARVLTHTRVTARAKRQCPLLPAFVLLGLVGCTVVPDQGLQSGNSAEGMRVQGASTHPIAGGSSAELAASRASQSSFGAADTGMPSLAEEPVAVIELPPIADSLSLEMTARLREVAEAAKADERVTLSLEGFVPDGGSPQLNIGLAEQSLMVVRKQLIAMRVPVGRIQIIPFGEHHNRARSPTNHWVEIYVRVRDR